MSEQFPIFRLATLLARQLSSPIATRIKEYAKSHPRFGRSVCMRGGRAAAAVELRFKMWSLQLRPSSAPLAALTDARALDAGADLLGEMILFSFGATIIIYEVNRQAIKQEAKAAAKRAAWLATQLQAEELRRELRHQQHHLDTLAARLQRLARPDPGTSPTEGNAPEPKPPPVLSIPPLLPGTSPAPKNSPVLGIPPVLPGTSPEPKTSPVLGIPPLLPGTSPEPKNSPVLGIPPVLPGTSPELKTSPVLGIPPVLPRTSPELKTSTVMGIPPALPETPPKSKTTSMLGNPPAQQGTAPVLKISPEPGTTNLCPCPAEPTRDPPL